MKTARLIVLGLMALALGSCASTGIALKEQLGYAKREQLVDRIESAQGAQEDAREQFESTLDRLRALSGQEAGELEDAYRSLSRSLERSRDRAAAVADRIDGIEAVGSALFTEWERELDEYQTESLRRASADQLRATRERYEAVLGAMRRAESRMDPVLAAFSDQVLFLKHNLNARAIAALDQTLGDIEGDVQALIESMNASIREAQAFIAEMGAP